MQANGTAILLRLFEIEPRARGYFGFLRGLSDAEIPENPRFKEHALAVMRGSAQEIPGSVFPLFRPPFPVNTP